MNIYVAEVWNPKLNAPLDNYFSTKELAEAWVQSYNKAFYEFAEGFVWKCTLDSDDITDAVMVSHIVFDRAGGRTKW